MIMTAIFFSSFGLKKEGGAKYREYGNHSDTQTQKNRETENLGARTGALHRYCARIRLE